MPLPNEIEAFNLHLNRDAYDVICEHLRTFSEILNRAITIELTPAITTGSVVTSRRPVDRAAIARDETDSLISTEAGETVPGLFTQQKIYLTGCSRNSAVRNAVLLGGGPEQPNFVSAVNQVRVNGEAVIDMQAPELIERGQQLDATGTETSVEGYLRPYRHTRYGQDGAPSLIITMQLSGQVIHRLLHNEPERIQAQEDLDLRLADLMRVNQSGELVMSQTSASAQPPPADYVPKTFGR